MNKTAVAQPTKTSNVLPPAQGMLQRKCACGNQTLGGVECAECVKKKSGLQRKLAIGTSNDPLEREADRVADQVIAAPAHSAVNGTSPRVQRYSGQATEATDTAPASVDRVLAGSGKPLEPALRQDMEQRFGHDFSQVRVHSDSAAEQSVRDVNANAYTVQHNIVFGIGQFAPETHEGRRLLAHELAHVVQQSSADEIIAGQGDGKSTLATPSPIGIQRQTKTDDQVQEPWKMMRIYSFGPSGAGRVVLAGGGETVFSPAAPVDAKGNELVQAGTLEQPKRARFGRYFTLDERHRPYPPPIPECAVMAEAEWKPDDGSTSSKDEKADNAVNYYAAGEPLGTKLGSEYIFPNDRPGVMSIQYLFHNFTAGVVFSLRHHVHFVNDPAAPIGATVPNDQAKKQEASAAAAPSAAKAVTESPEKKPEAKGASLPSAVQKAPPAEVGQIKELTELIQKTSDAAVRDPLVRKLRDLFSKLQPLMPAKDAQQAIDDAIKSLVKEGADSAIMAILKGITGKSPTTMPEDRNQTGPDVAQKNLDEHIIKGPKIAINDAPALAPKFSFQYKNGPRKSYEPGVVITFTLTGPDNFSSLQGAKRVVIVAEADRNAPNPERFARVALESAAPTNIEMQAPQKPGKYVIRVDIGLGFDYSNMQEFDVNAPQKK